MLFRRCSLQVVLRLHSVVVEALLVETELRCLWISSKIVVFCQSTGGAELHGTMKKSDMWDGL